jgi:O-antigen/teichoic acid export membrane protein
MISSFILPPLFINNFDENFYATILVVSSLAPWLGLSLLGSPQYIVTILPQIEPRHKKYDQVTFGFLVTTFAVFLSFMILLTSGFDGFFSKEVLERYSTFIYLSITALIFKYSYDFIIAVLTGYFLIHIAKILEILLVLVNIFTVLFVIFFGSNIIFIPITNLVFNIILIILCLFLFSNKLNLFINWGRVKIFIKGTLPFFWFGMPGMVFWNTDILLLNHFLKSSDVISYSILFRVITIFLIAFGVFNNIIVPYISKKYAQREYDFLLKNFERQVFVYSFAILLLSVLFIQYVDIFIDYWIGADRVIIDKDAVLGFTLFFLTYCLSSILNIHVLAFNAVKEVVFVVWMEALLNLISSFFLIKLFGMKGVIMGTTLAIICTQMIFMPKFVFSKLKCNKFIFNIFYRNYFFIIGVIFLFYFIDRNDYLLNFGFMFFMFFLFFFINKSFNVEELATYIRNVILSGK